MIRLLLEPCNLLILDEPTNHLDMQSKDVLKAALKDFDGTLICVSHDRDFLNGLVSKVYEFGGGRVKEHLGGIYDFLRTKKLTNLEAIGYESATNPRQYSRSNANRELTTSAQDYAAQKAAAAEKRKKEKQIAEVEAAIAALETQQAEMEQMLASPENQTQENFQRYESIKHQIEQKLYEWEILSE